ncbi:MAG TPA: DNA mismatch repair endonuclease MutL, partial [Chthoniobacteraceae bacterium]|nr:DNA mismatch repair endonuclease MutL [Chthoniobacteraceae bacterium]
ALREGYHTALMKGQHPVTFLFIDMDPAAVDVNVHPAKREVRFRDAASVREAVVEAVRRTLETDRAGWSRSFRPGEPAAPPESSAGAAASDRAFAPSAAFSPFSGAPASAAQPLPLIPEREQVALRHDWSSLPSQAHAAPPIDKSGASLSTTGVPAAARSSTPTEAAGANSRPHEFQILGVLGKLYVLMENADGLVLVDQHAAHERILFEEMRRRMEQQGVPAQRLLMPLTLEVTPRDADWLSQHLMLLERAGINLEPFGVATFKIDTLPTFLRSSDPSQLLRDIIDDLRETVSQDSRLRLGEEMIAKTVCRHAVKANDYLREPELVRLVQDLLACELPYCCPHGRPTMIQISYLELEKKFGRKA